jgi:hypothetical protein
MNPTNTRRSIGEDLERQVVIAHDEFVARQGIQGFDQLLRLRNSKIARIRHADMLALQKALPGCFVQERERLRQDEGERGGEQRIVHSDDCRGGILLDPEHGPEAGLRGSAVFERLAAEEHPAGRQNLRERRSRQREALPLAVQKKA